MLGTNEEEVPIILKKGPFGPYVQLGDNIKDKKKIKKVFYSKNIDISNVTLEYATQLLSLPREVGVHPETGISLYLQTMDDMVPIYNIIKSFFRIPKGEDPLNIGINRAIDILSQPKKRATNRTNAIKSLGVYEKLKSKVELL